MLKLTLKLFLVSICTCFISTSCFAGISDGSITNLLKASGITKQVSELPGLFKAGIDQARPNLEQLVIASMVYSYRAIDLTDLKKYEAFLNNSQSTQFSKRVVEGMTIGLERCISKWANSIAGIAKEKGI